MMSYTLRFERMISDSKLPVQKHAYTHWTRYTSERKQPAGGSCHTVPHML